MKSKPSLLQILSSMLIICVILISCNESNKSKDLTVTKKSDTGENIISFAPYSKSGAISKDSAKLLRDSYKRYSHALHTIDGKIKPLEGFALDAAELKEIIDNNASGEKPDKVILYFGLDSTAGGIKWHLIEYGMKQNTLLDYSRVKGLSPGKLSTPSMYGDKGVPCPPCNFNSITGNN